MSQQDYKDGCEVDNSVVLVGDYKFLMIIMTYLCTYC